jgi:hypothetical protein
LTIKFPQRTPLAGRAPSPFHGRHPSLAVIPGLEGSHTDGFMALQKIYSAPRRICFRSAGFRRLPNLFSCQTSSFPAWAG